jgi:hypothetical protein
MRYTSTLAAAALLLATIVVSGTRAQAQQEVAPTAYPLTPAVAHPSHQPVVPRTVKQSSVQHTQRASEKKTQNPSASGAHHVEAKSEARQ